MTPAWLNDVIERLNIYLPPEVSRIVVATAIVLAGYCVARLLKLVSIRIFRKASSWLVRSANQLSPDAQHRVGLKLAKERSAAVSVGAAIVFWLIMILALSMAANVLGFPIVSRWFEGLAGYLPRVLVSVAILLLGILVGRLLRVSVEAASASTEFHQGSLLARIAQAAIVLLSVVMAVDELGIQINMLVIVIAIVLASGLSAIALSFGLGAKQAVENLIACHYLAKWYKIGQVVEIGEHKGRIIEILPTAVILQTKAAKVSVPAKEFARSPSLLCEDKE